MTKIYHVNNGAIDKLEELSFNSEEEIRSLVEANLDTLLSLELLASEFRIKNFRIDTLAFDPVNNSFVIIEYKKAEKLSLIDQGFAYLSLMLRRKEAFTLEYNNTLNKSLTTSDINWSASRVVFVSQSFTPYQHNLACFKDLPVELFTVKRFSGNIIAFEKLSAPDILSMTNLPKQKHIPGSKKKKPPAAEVKPPTITHDLNEKLMKKIFG